MDKRDGQSDERKKKVRRIDITKLERKRSERKAVQRADISSEPVKPVKTQDIPTPPSEVSPATSRIQEQVRLKSKLESVEVDEDFLKSYSFAPACGVYLFARQLWFFLIAPLMVIVLLYINDAPIWLIAATAVAIIIFPLYAVFMLVTLGFMIIDSPWEVYRELKTFAGPNGIAAFFYAGVLVLIIAFAGLIARRGRWYSLEWGSFADFKASEKTWQAVGIVLWIVLIAFIVGVLFGEQFVQFFGLIFGDDFK